MNQQPPDTADAESGQTQCPVPPAEVAIDDLVGLAFSGGGIRSASFNLGVLQGLASRRALWMFDYLSTVSGGGFIGSWWSAWLSREKRRPGDIFPPPEELEPERRVVTDRLLDRQTPPPRTAPQPDGSLAASRHDPVHFVRLFSNYLTPRTGALSPDTWRLIAFFVRNLLFTWMTLLPILLAAVMAGQLYFLRDPEIAKSFLCTAGQVHRLCTGFEADGTRALAERWAQFLWPMKLWLTAYVTLIFLWLMHASASRLLALAGFAVSFAAGYLLFFHDSASTGPFPTAIVVVCAGTILWHLAQAYLDDIRLRSITLGDAVTDDQQVKATSTDHRGWLSSQQAMLLEWGTLFGFVLLVAGFGHDLVTWIFYEAEGAVAKAGGWGVVAATAASTIYTAVHAAPSSDGTAPPPPGRLGKIALMAAPPLVVLTLTLLFAVLSRQLLLMTLDWDQPTLALAAAVIWIALLEVVFALYESAHDPADVPPAWWRQRVPGWLQSLLRLSPPPAVPKRGLFNFFTPRTWTRLIVVPCAAAMVHYLGSASPGALWQAVAATWGSLVAVSVIAAGFLLSFARTSWRIAMGSARPVWLLAIASLTATLCLLASGQFPGIHRPELLAGLLWLALLIGGVIAMGWMADPNLLSLHAFYKARLTRAYLGASNAARDNDEITDSAPGDDLLLTALWNHDAGAPYHLINTTLSLVGGSDLATSQRSAENFLMSRYHCGSARAGYRCTAEYMSGQLSLGTAAAISGAAVSPNMGSQTPSAALALLLSLLNVRLGFWAPNPSGRRWDEPQARLWPFYLLRETLSNTGRLGAYCYLTDGGHFDNTALYALIERGCKYIVFCDCGADPKPGFEDIGVAIRRCRIDFGTEIDLDVDEFTARDGVGAGVTHVVVGRIRYQATHLEILGLDPTRREGRLLWIKPSVTARDAADVRQYKMAHADFPQQSTADQWYDESQFESYRRLGYESALEAFGIRADDPHGAAPLPAPGQFADIEPWFLSRRNRTPAR